MKTKAFHAFQQKMIYFTDDLELVDYLCENIRKRKLSRQYESNVFSNLDISKYTNLARRSNSDGTRKLLATHLKKTFYSAYIKDIYEEVTEYLREIFFCYFKCNIDNARLIGEHNINIYAQDLLNLGTWDCVCRYVSNTIFQALENERSTIKLLDKMQRKIDINISKQIIDTAIPYLQIRHFLVHQDGVVTQDFILENPQFNYEKNKVKLNYEFIVGFNNAISQLIEEFDKKIIEKECLSKEFIIA